MRFQSKSVAARHRSTFAWSAVAAAVAFSTAPARADMVSHYAFDGNTADGGTLGNTAGVLVGNAGFDTGILGQALRLEGGYFDTNQDAPYDFIGGPLTFSFWAKLDGSWDKDWECMIAKGENQAWRLARRAGSNTEVRYSTFVNATADLRDNEWHHFVATNTAGTTRIYFDGTLVASGGGTISTNTNTSLRIGSNPQASNREFGGWIDDVGIWNVVLSAEWAKAMYDLALDPAFQYDAGQVNQLGMLHAAGEGTLQIAGTPWQYAASDPNDGFPFIPFAADGSGVHVIPEPSSALLALLGLVGLLMVRRKR